MMCSHPGCLTEHWIALMANYTMAPEPESTEMLALARAIRDGKVTSLECLRGRSNETIAQAVARIRAKGRRQRPQRQVPDLFEQDRKYLGYLRPPKP